MLSPPSTTDEWLLQLYETARRDLGPTTTANRQVNGIRAGDFHYDTTIGKPIWYDGTNWKDAAGTIV